MKTTPNYDLPYAEGTDDPSVFPSQVDAPRSITIDSELKSLSDRLNTTSETAGGMDERVSALETKTGQHANTLTDHAGQLSKHSEYLSTTMTKVSEMDDRTLTADTALNDRILQVLESTYEARESVWSDPSFESTGMIPQSANVREITDEWSLKGSQSFKFTYDGTSSINGVYIYHHLIPGHTYALRYTVMAPGSESSFIITANTSANDGSGKLTYPLGSSVSRISSQTEQIKTKTVTFTLPSTGINTTVRFFFAQENPPSAAAGTILYLDSLYLVDITDIAPLVTALKAGI